MPINTSSSPPMCFALVNPNCFLGKLSLSKKNGKGLETFSHLSHQPASWPTIVWSCIYHVLDTMPEFWVTGVRWGVIQNILSFLFVQPSCMNARCMYSSIHPAVINWVLPVSPQQYAEAILGTLQCTGFVPGWLVPGYAPIPIAVRS